MRRSTLLNSWSAHPTASPFLCLLLAAAPACDDPDAFDVEDTLHAERDDEEPDAASVEPFEGSLTAAPRPQAAGDFPRYEILPPVRMDDLKPRHYPRLFQNADRWHDMNIYRNDGGWTKQMPGTTDELGELARGTPVYSGVDGEVMACWRSVPYNEHFSAHSDIMTSGANFMVIRTTAPDRWFYYAHMDTNSIPFELCPKTSVNVENPGYLAVGSKSQRVCGDWSSCSVAETYIPAGSRPQVRAGQFIGRMGAIGNAAEHHLHMGSGEAIVDNGIDRAIQSGAHIIFEHTWQAPGSSTLPISWTPSAGPSIPDGVTAGELLLWPWHKREETYSSSYRLSKFGGSTGADLLCHDTDQGNLYIDGDAATAPEFGASDWTRAANWCTAGFERLHTGDFNGDGRTDLLCHHIDTGAITIDHGAHNAGTGTTEFNGVDFTHASGYCGLPTMQLRIGDFDSDGRDDLLCHDHADGRRWIDRAIDGFTGSNQTLLTPWCAGLHQRLHVGRFDSAGAGEDLLCHDTFSGQIWIDAAPSTADIANGVPIFSPTDTHVAAWCNGGGERLFAANVVGTGALDELVCHDSDNGATRINVPTVNENYPGTSSTGAVTGACTDPYDRLRFGDFNGDGRDDLLCFNVRTGARAIDYSATEASPGGVFAGIENTSSGWCYQSDQSLH